MNSESEPKISKYGSTYALGDKVIQNVNNYDKEVFNGDIGTVQKIDLEKSLLHIQFDDRVIEYEFNELDEVSLAYSASIHKSQGSEFRWWSLHNRRPWGWRTESSGHRSD